MIFSKHNRLLILFLIITSQMFSCGQERRQGAGGSMATGNKGQPMQTSEPVRQLIAEGLDTLDVKTYFIDKNIREELYQELTNFYEAGNYQLAWHSSEGPLPVACELQQALAGAPAEGLGFDYHLDTLQLLNERLFAKKRGKADLEQLVRLDFLTTAAYLTYASHLLSGVANPAWYDESRIASPRSADLAQHLQSALQTGQIGQSLQRLIPEHLQYHRLKEALARYRQIEERGGWPALPKNTTLNKGDTSDAVRLLRQRLQSTGDLEGQPQIAAAGNKSDNGTIAAGAQPAGDRSVNPATIMDEPVAAGLARYQQRNGLTADSVLGPSTLKWLNVPVAKRIRQIQLNLERLRWWPSSFGEKYVLVNVPEYRLRVYEGQEKKLEMRVIVGKEYRSTPIFRDTIRYIEFSPTWNVPRSIAVRDILPAVKRNPAYLRRQNMKLYRAGSGYEGQEIDPYQVDWAKLSAARFPYQIVQQPGPGNALGQIKFMFPNKIGHLPARYARRPFI